MRIVQYQFVVKTAILSASVFMLLTSNAIRSADEDPLTALRDQDRTTLFYPGKNSNMVFAASFVMTTKGWVDPAQGLQMDTCRAIWDGQSYFAKITSDYEHAPVFRTSGSPYNGPINYNPEGKLVVWRSASRYIAFTSNQNDVVETTVCHEVSSRGTIVGVHTNTSLYRYQIGNHDSIYMIDQLFMATGRGIAKHLKEIVKARLPADGSPLLELACKGTYANSAGMWKLSCDLELGYLIREAAFTYDGTDKPVLTISNAGLVECAGLTLAKTGVFRSAPIEAQFQVLGLKCLDSSGFITNAIRAEALERINADLPRGRSRINDYRGAKPKVMSVE